MNILHEGELKENCYYRAIYQSSANCVIKVKKNGTPEGTGVRNDVYYNSNWFVGATHYTDDVTLAEIEWLEACINKGRLIPLNEVMPQINNNYEIF